MEHRKVAYLATNYTCWSWWRESPKVKSCWSFWTKISIQGINNHRVFRFNSPAFVVIKQRIIRSKANEKVEAFSDTNHLYLWEMVLLRQRKFNTEVAFIGHTTINNNWGAGGWTPFSSKVTSSGSFLFKSRYLMTLLFVSAMRSFPENWTRNTFNKYLW